MNTQSFKSLVDELAKKYALNVKVNDKGELKWDGLLFDNRPKCQGIIQKLFLDLITATYDNRSAMKKLSDIAEVIKAPET